MNAFELQIAALERRIGDHSDELKSLRTFQNEQEGASKVVYRFIWPLVVLVLSSLLALVGFMVRQQSAQSVAIEGLQKQYDTLISVLKEGKK